MNTRLTKLFLSLLIASSATSHAGNLFVSLDKYDYNTNLADFDLEYEPIGATIGARFDLSENSYLQVQYGLWSEESANVPGPDMASSDFDSTLINIGVGYDLSLIHI